MPEADGVPLGARNQNERDRLHQTCGDPQTTARRKWPVELGAPIFGMTRGAMDHRMANNRHRRTRRSLSIVGPLAAGLILLAGCASSPSGRAGAASAQVCPKAEYKIGPGDQLDIFVFNEKDLSGVVPVRPDGYISMPLISRLAAAGKTPSELAGEIQKRLGEYLRAPQVNVIVTHFVGMLDEQIRVVGQGVEKPIALPYKSGTKVMDVVIQAGQLAPYASLNHARIERKEPQGKKEIRVRLGDLLNRGDERQNLAMCPGDVLVIPQSMF